MGTVTKIQAPVRTHSVITPQVTRVEPEIAVNQYTVEVPVAVPVPVEREVIVEKHVAKPYAVEVPQPYAVPQPYKVHPVHQVVETPSLTNTTLPFTNLLLLPPTMLPLHPLLSELTLPLLLPHMSELMHTTLSLPL